MGYDLPSFPGVDSLHYFGRTLNPGGGCLRGPVSGLPVAGEKIGGQGSGSQRTLVLGRPCFLRRMEARELFLQGRYQGIQQRGELKKKAPLGEFAIQL